jgi:CHAT domain-containing protein
MPSYSSAVLAADPHGKHDGLLNAFEVQRLDLTGSLVVLSACETGCGQTSLPGEQLSLERAFLVAGADVVVSSLWEVSDQSTRDLMIAFHRARAAGKHMDVALAGAMNTVRHGSPDPHSWGAFRVVAGALEER